jgi:DNA-binding NtrC family response regulator
LQEIKQRDFSVQVIMITAYTSFDKTLQSLQFGAIDYVLKPIDDMNELLELIRESSRRVKRWRKVLKDSVFLKK